MHPLRASQRNTYGFLLQNMCSFGILLRRSAAVRRGKCDSGSCASQSSSRHAVHEQRYPEVIEGLWSTRNLCFNHVELLSSEEDGNKKDDRCPEPDTRQRIIMSESLRQIAPKDNHQPRNQWYLLKESWTSSTHQETF